MATRTRPVVDRHERRRHWSILADPCLRRILSILEERSSTLEERSHPATERDIAVQLATLEGKRSPATDGPWVAVGPATSPASDVRRLLLDLHHRHLPKLEGAGWIERRPDGIVATDRAPFGSPDGLVPPIGELDASLEQPHERLSRVVFALPRRPLVVAVLARHEGTVTLDELAAELAATDRVLPATDRGDLAATLHHVDLPRLEEVGLCSYDPDERTVVPEPVLATIAHWIDRTLESEEREARLE